MGSILSQKYLRSIFRKCVVAVVMGNKPFRGLVIMFIHQIGPLLSCGPPPSVVFPACRKGAAGANDPYLRIFLPDRLMEKRVPFKKRLSHLLITDTDIFQMKRFGMSHFGPPGAPERVCIPIGKFDQIQCILDISFQFISHSPLAGMGIIAPGKYRNRLCT